MPFTLNNIPNCYYLKASFYRNKKDPNNGFEIEIWNSRGKVTTKCRNQILHQIGKKYDFDSIEDSMAYCYQFGTGEKPMSMYLLIHSPYLEMVGEINISNLVSAKIVGVFADSNQAIIKAKEIITHNELTPPNALYIVSVCGRVSLEPILVSVDVLPKENK